MLRDYTHILSCPVFSAWGSKPRPLCAREAESPTQETLSCLSTMDQYPKVNAQCGYANQLIIVIIS